MIRHYLSRGRYAVLSNPYAGNSTPVANGVTITVNYGQTRNYRANCGIAVCAVKRGVGMWSHCLAGRSSKMHLGFHCKNTG